jgi:GntR family transcriptional regulator, transcriptional repressor for pyruvate dehydrogenase complex
MSAVPASAPLTSAIDTVFEALLADIVRGTYPAGTRLPAERELSRLVGASRPTLREALRRLGEWNLVTARRGSGIVVREVRDWTIEIVPAFLRYGSVTHNSADLARFLGDLLGLRKHMICDIVRMSKDRLEPGATQNARTACQRAWATRDDTSAFAVHDFGITRALVEAAGLMPSMWMVNRLGAMYLDLAKTLIHAARPPDDYLESFGKVFDLLEAGDTVAAEATLADYYDRHDQRLLALLGLG